MTRLNYGEVVDIGYVTSDAGIVLSPEQQSLAVQAVSIFRELYNWTDGNSEADNIDALVASTIAALLWTDVPPKDDMNNRTLLLTQFSTVTVGGQHAWQTTLGYWVQTIANGNSYRWNVDLPPGDWRLQVWANMNNASCIMNVKAQGVISAVNHVNANEDLYSVAVAANQRFPYDFTLTDTEELYIILTANSKRAASSSYALGVISVELIRLD